MRVCSCNGEGLTEADSGARWWYRPGEGAGIRRRLRGWRGSWTQAQIPLLTSLDNETGILKELFSALRASASPTRVPILLHTDAAQAIGKIPVSGPELGADLVTIVGHKFYGPRIGALYHRKGVAVSPMFYGGGQETGLQPGTENTPMIAGLGAACGLVTRNLDTYSRHMRTVRDFLVDQFEEGSTKLFQCNACWMLELNMLMGEM